MSFSDKDLKYISVTYASQTYQRATVLPVGAEPLMPETDHIANEKRLSAEQFMNCVLVAAGSRDKPREVDLAKVRAAFVEASSHVPQDPEVELSPLLKSSLFVLNDPLVLDCLTRQSGNLVERLLKTTDTATLANELYLSALTRKPTDEERAAIAEIQASPFPLAGSRSFCGNCRLGISAGWRKSPRMSAAG